MFILLKTGTRGAFLGLLAALLIFLVVNLFLIKKRRVQILIAVLLLIPVLSVSAFFTNPEAPIWNKIPVLDRLINYRSAITDIQPRIWTWESAMAGTLERPLLGWGLENFAEPFDKYYNPKHFGIESFFDRTHNVFLEYTISGGILLLLSWLMMFWFYYWELFKRKKTLWWSILLVTPIAYFIQGFFLFDVLAIYLILFVFLLLFISEKYDSAVVDGKENKLKDSVSLSVGVIAFIVLFTSLYFASYLPLRKNLLLSGALQSQQISMIIPITTLEEARAFIDHSNVTFSKFEDAYAFRSPVGQEETIGSMMKYALATIERAHAVPALANMPETRILLKKMADKSNIWSEENKNIMTGLKNEFINAVVNVQISLVPTPDGKEIRVVDPIYIAKGKKMLEDALEIAPTRIEMIRILMRVAEIEKDQEAREEWIEKADFLRPDIDWETTR